MLQLWPVEQCEGTGRGDTGGVLVELHAESGGQVYAGTSTVEGGVETLFSDKEWGVVEAVLPQVYADSLNKEE